MNREPPEAVKGSAQRLRTIVRIGVPFVEPALIVAFVFLMAIPVAEELPTIATLRAMRAQELIEELRDALSIDRAVQIAVVIHHPLVFAVEPADARKERFLLSMELGFLKVLDDEELRAALAHELGHVWIFTHHPFLHTERLANSIGQRAVDRDSFERLYSKLWRYEGTSGVAMEQLLGPRPALPVVTSQPDIVPLPGLTGRRP